MVSWKARASRLPRHLNEGQPVPLKRLDSNNNKANAVAEASATSVSAKGILARTCAIILKALAVVVTILKTDARGVSEHTSSISMKRVMMMSGTLL